MTPVQNQDDSWLLLRLFDGISPDGKTFILFWIFACGLGVIITLGIIAVLITELLVGHGLP